MCSPLARSSPASAASTSASNGPEASAPSGSARRNHSAAPSSKSDGRESPSMAISERWTGRISPALIYSSEGSHARTSALPANAKELRRAIAPACGSSSGVQSQLCDHATSSSRTSPASSAEAAWTSFWLTLGASVTERSGRFCWKQPQSALPITESVSSLLPTPNASLFNDSESPESFQAQQEKWKGKYHNSMPMAVAAKLLPTPTQGDSKSAKWADHQRKYPHLHAIVEGMLPTPAARD